MEELISALSQYGGIGILSGVLIFFLIKFDKNHREDRKETMEAIRKQYEKMDEVAEKHHRAHMDAEERRHKDVLDLTGVLSDIKNLIRQ